MLETGDPQFGADVLPGQCNFCGLGATGAGQKGAVFENVALGLRAQVQHLKAYGSKDLPGERLRRPASLASCQPGRGPLC